MSIILIADSGATKCEWALLRNGRKKTFFTQGMSPYFLSALQLQDLIRAELLPSLKGISPDEIYFFGTGLFNPDNRRMMRTVLKKIFPDAGVVKADHDMMAVAQSLCGADKGVACILGTGSNSCFYNGKKITQMRTGLGYVLGDEGSGSYLGKKVLQYYLYGTFDDELRQRFDEKYGLSHDAIINQVYREPLPNRFLGSFTTFLSENRGHYMIENILEDGFNDFITMHIYKYREAWTSPVYFSGGVAYAFKDVLLDLCNSYELTVGGIVKEPMPGLIRYYMKK